MGSGYSQPLSHKGPYQKPAVTSSFLGIPMTNYTMPLINPEDGSYMPTCSPGPCVQYVYTPYFDRGVMRQRSQCVRYGPPTRIPQQTNMFSLQPGSPRHSCGWSNPDNNSQYYVAYNPQAPVQQVPVQQVPVQQVPVQQVPVEQVPPFQGTPGPEYKYGVVTGGLKKRKSMSKGKTLKRKNKQK